MVPHPQALVLFSRPFLSVLNSLLASVYGSGSSSGLPKKGFILTASSFSHFRYSRFRAAKMKPRFSNSCCKFFTFSFALEFSPFIASSTFVLIWFPLAILAKAYSRTGVLNLLQRPLFILPKCFYQLRNLKARRRTQ
jgi:hypothetical protein